MSHQTDVATPTNKYLNAEAVVFDRCLVWHHHMIHCSSVDSVPLSRFYFLVCIGLNWLELAEDQTGVLWSLNPAFQDHFTLCVTSPHKPVVGGEKGGDENRCNTSFLLNISTGNCSPSTHNRPESKYTPQYKSDMSISLSKDLPGVLLQLLYILCFSTVLQSSLFLLKAATWTNPSRNLDRRLRVAMLGAKMAFHLRSFVERDGQTKRHLSRQQGDSVCAHGCYGKERQHCSRYQCAGEKEIHISIVRTSKRLAQSRLRWSTRPRMFSRPQQL